MDMSRRYRKLDKAKGGKRWGEWKNGRHLVASTSDVLAPNRLSCPRVDALAPLSARDEQVPVKRVARLEKAFAVSRACGRGGVGSLFSSAATVSVR